MATSWHLTSVAVLGGALHGTKLDIEDVVVEVLIGSDPDCHLHIDLPTVSPIHARLWIEPDDVTVYGTRSGPGVFINFDRVDGEGKLAPGDMLWLGPPQEPGSVMLQARFEERDSLPPAIGVPMVEEDAAVSTETEAPVEPAPVSLSPSALGFDEPAAPDPVPTPVAQPAPVPEPVPVAPIPVAIPIPVAPIALPSLDEPPPVPFDDFLVMDQGTAPPEPAVGAPLGGDEFIVSGFEAEWPDLPAIPPPTEAPPTLPLSAPAPAAPVVDRVDDAFFMTDDLPSALPAVPPPLPPKGEVPPAPPRAVPTPKPAVPPLPTAAPPVAKPPVAPPVAAPATPAPAAKTTAPMSPPPAKAPAATSVPAARPDTTGSARPVRRPDVSQQVPRSERPSSPRPDRTVPPPRARAASSSPLPLVAAAGIVALALLGIAWYFLAGGITLQTVTPARSRVGEVVALSGKGFAAEPAANTVFFGEREASVKAATSTRLEVLVPDVVASGGEQQVAVRVKVGRSESKPVSVAVYSGPTLHGISPDVAMPGDEVVLAGSAWGPAPSVRFGGLAAEVLETRETSIRVRVPQIEGGSGTAAPVVVASGTLESNPGPFFVGRIPLVMRAEPTTVSPGDVITLGGRGFRRERVQNSVEIGGVRALVVSARDEEIKVVVPRVAAGSRSLDVRVPSSAAATQVALVVNAAGPSVGFRFIAEPFEAVPGRDHAVVATGLGPAFVLASSGGRSGAERALEAAERLNAAGPALMSSPDLAIALRNPDTAPEVGLAGRPDVLLEVTAEDAAAYAEDWTRARGGTVTRGRLARWWEAVAKDLVQLLLRGQGPHFAADLAPEGRVFQEFFQASRRAGGAGVSAEVVSSARPALRDAMRLVAFRVPASVRAPEGAPVAADPRPQPSPSESPSGSSNVPMPRLDGAWTGTENESGRQQYLTATFRGNTGTLAFEGAISVSAPMLSVDQPQRGAARFTVELRGGLRYYSGRWNGLALVGKISTDPGGASAIGTFELRPPR